MNSQKIFNVILSCSIAFPVYAQEIPGTAGKSTVTNLVADNKMLAQSISDQKIALEHEAHLFRRPDQYRQLTEILNTYQNFIDRKGSLPQDKRRALDQIVDASAQVGHIRERGANTKKIIPAQQVVNVPKSENVLQENKKLKEDLRLLREENLRNIQQAQQAIRESAVAKELSVSHLNDDKTKELQKDHEQIVALKQELAKTTDRLEAATASASERINQTTIDKENLLKNKEALLQEKETKMAALQDELSRIKDELSKTNNRYEEAIQEFKEKTKNAKLDADESSRLARQLADKTAAFGDLSAKNQELARTIESLNNNSATLASLEAQLIEKDNKIAELKSRLAQEMEQNSLMRQQLAQQENDVRQIRDKAESNRQQYLEQAKLVDLKEKDIKRLNEQMAGLPKVADNQQEAEQLRAQIAKAKQEADELRNHLSQTANALTESKKALDAKDQLLAQMQASLAKLPNDAVIKKETDETANQLAIAKAKINELQSQLTHDDHVFALIKDKGMVLKNKISSLSNALELKNSEIANLTALKEKAASRAQVVEVVKAQQQPAVIQEAVASSSDDNVKKALKEKLALSARDIQELKDQIKNLKEVQLARTDRERIKELQDQLVEAQAKQDALQQQVVMLKQATDQTVAKSQFDELKKQYDMLVKAPPVKVDATQVNAARKEAEALKQEIASLTASKNEADQLKEKIAALETAKAAEKTAAEAQFVQLKNQLVFSQEQFNALKTEILKNREIITVKQDQSISLQVAVKEQLGKIADKTTEIQTKNNRLSLQDILQAKQRQHVDLLMAKNQLLTDYQHILVNKLTAYKSKFDGAQGDWSIHEKEYAKQIADFKATIESMNRNNAQLTAALGNAKNEKEQAYQLVDRFKDRLKETADVNEDQSKQLAKIRKRSEDLEGALSKLQDEMASKQGAVEASQEELAKLKTEHDQALQDVQVKDLSLSMAQASMQAKTKLLQKLVDQLKDQIKIADAQVASLHQQLKDADAKVAAANRHEDLDRLKEMLKSSREELIQLNNVIKNKEQQVAKLQNDLQDNSIDFTGQQKAINALKQDMDQQQAVIKKLNIDIDWKNKEIARLKTQLKEKKIDLLPGSLQGVELVIAKDRQQIAELTAQLAASKNRINAVSIPIVSDPQGLRRALLDAQEQIATLKEKLHQKLGGLVKNDPSVIAMNKEIESLRQRLADVMKENGNLKDKNQNIFDDMQSMQADLGKCQEQIKAIPAKSENLLRQ